MCFLSLSLSAQLHPLRVRPGERAESVEGEQRQPAERQPVAQRGHHAGRFQHAHAQGGLKVGHPERQRSQEPRPQRYRVNGELQRCASNTTWTRVINLVLLTLQSQNNNMQLDFDFRTKVTSWT